METISYVDAKHRTVFRGTGGTSAPVVYVVDAAEHPFDIGGLVRGRACTVVKLPFRVWNDSLTPWPAPGLYRGEPDFGGQAALTLAELNERVIPEIESAEGLAPSARALCGYSLGGLFSLFAFTHSDAFAACACLSGSVWYEGWVDHLRELEFDGAGRFAFLSIGTKEKHAAPKILHHVQSDMEECATILRTRGCQAEFALGPGNHMSFVEERFEAGLCALEAFLTRGTAHSS